MTATPFFLPVRVYYEDTDAGGIVYYANYFKYAERARTELLRSMGDGRRSELENSIAFVVTQATSRYVRPARLDDLLHVSCDITSIKGTRLVFRQCVTQAEDGTVCADLDVTVCTVDLNTMKPVRIPDRVRRMLPTAS